MKLKQRVVLGSITIIVCLTFFIFLQVPDSAVPNFIKKNYKLRSKEELFGSHISAVRKRLNKSNFSSDDFSPEKGGGEKSPAVDDPENGGDFWSMSGEKGARLYADNFSNMTDRDVNGMFRKLQEFRRSKFDFDKIRDMKYYDFLSTMEARSKPPGRSLTAFKTFMGSMSTNWEKFHKGIHQFGLYDGHGDYLEDLLRDMTQEPIVDVEQKDGGTQLKLIITFTDEGQALFKPKRFGRDYITPPDHFYFVDFERHNAEIAAFHLDRIIGFYRVPPTIGRIVNVTYDIKRLADHKLAKTFFRSPAGNICFHGSCSYYCDTTHAVCGNPDMMEGSFATFLPPEKIAPRKTWRNPWKRSYSKHRKAYWEVYNDLCDKVKLKEPYNHGRRLNDLLDTHIFDYLTGNMDRHHYETFRDFGNETFALHYDNGRAFGKTEHDEKSILAPIYQCCRIRYSTFMKLAKMYMGPEKLGYLMAQSLKMDSLYPILPDPHYKALDRRVMNILKEIAICLENTDDVMDVIVDDYF